MKSNPHESENRDPDGLRVFSPNDKRQRSTVDSRFSVVIPCYNEEGAILDTIAAIRRDLTGHAYELVVVDDGSTDGTGQLLQQAVDADPSLCVLTHADNQGYGASLKTGIRHARSDLIVITDADGTYPNERIPDLVRLAERADMVVGARTAPNAQYPFLRKIPKAFLRRYASWIAAQSIPDLNSGLRVFRRQLALNLSYLISDGFSFTTTITLAMMTNKYKVIFEPVGYAPRIGTSCIAPAGR